MGTVAVRIAIGAAILAVGLTGCSNGSGYRTEMRAAIWAVRSVSERNVEIVVINGGCIDYDHTDIELHADLVRLQVWNRVMVPTDNRHVCTANEKLVTESVRLAEPLGMRTIVGACTPGDDLQGRYCRDAMQMGGRT